MFVPVSCTNCGKPFQVPEAVLGQLAPCPWCQQTVTALPVSAPQPEPLPLDDEPPAPKSGVPFPGPRAPVRPVFNAVTLVIGTVLTLGVMAATVFVLGYGSGRLPDADWTEFTPPDGSFTVALPGRPAEADVEPLAVGSRVDGKRYTVHRWYAGLTVWVAQHDLEPGLVQVLPDDRSRAFATSVLVGARDREAARLRGTVTKEAGVLLNAAGGWGTEIQMDTPDGPVVERLILLGEGRRPQLFVLGVQGKRAAPDGPTARRLFGSFRVNG